ANCRVGGASRTHARAGAALRSSEAPPWAEGKPPTASRAPAVRRAIRTALATAEPSRGGEDRGGEVATPGAPRVSTGQDEEAMANAQPRELVREGDVLAKRPVAEARVEPDVGAASAKAPRDLWRVLGRTVVGEPRLLAPEDRQDVVGPLVARPALEHPELTGVMKADVQRPVAAFGQ